MADLSPQTLATLDAYMNNCGWLDGPFGRDYRCAANVLRAAAQQLPKVMWDGCIQPDAEMSIGINWSRDALHALADQLERAGAE